MSAEFAIEGLGNNDRDAILYMMMRREINTAYAEEQVDFNYIGLVAGQILIGRQYSAEDVIVDVGSSNGKIIGDAAKNMATQAHIVCIEPQEEAAEDFVRSKWPSSRMSFVRAIGEELPLADNSALGVTMHNTIFRAKDVRDAKTMILESKRVVRPGGFIAISSNAMGHAHYRHHFELQIAKRVKEITGADFNLPMPPAEGYYLEDLPKLIKEVGQLEIREDLGWYQDTRAIITRGSRFDNYIQSLKYSAASTNLPGYYYEVWRKVVETCVEPIIRQKIDEKERQNRVKGIIEEPYFADTIKRGMYLLVNQK